jgi:hypothetical protein
MAGEVLMVATQFQMTGLAEKCSRWLAQHFRRLWESQVFATLPHYLLDMCVTGVTQQMVIQNFFFHLNVTVYFYSQICPGDKKLVTV